MVGKCNGPTAIKGCRWDYILVGARQTGRMNYIARPPKKLISVDDACFVLGIGRTKVYALVKANDLRLVKLGRRSFFIADELDAFVATLTTQSREDAGHRRYGRAGA